MSIAVVMLYLLFCLCVCIVVIYHINQEKNRYEDWYHNERKECMSLIKQSHDLRMENIRLNNLLKQTTSTRANTPVVKQDKEIVYAVKYAMKAAHPDNGGKQQDFIKFNNLYNKIR